MNNLLAFPYSSNTSLQEKKNLQLEIAALREYEIELDQEIIELKQEIAKSVPFFKSVANSVLNCLKGLAIAFLVWASFVALIGLLSLI